MYARATVWRNAPLWKWLHNNLHLFRECVFPPFPLPSANGTRTLLRRDHQVSVYGQHTLLGSVQHTLLPTLPVCVRWYEHGKRFPFLCFFYGKLRPRKGHWAIPMEVWGRGTIESGFNLLLSMVHLICSNAMGQQFQRWEDYTGRASARSKFVWRAHMVDLHCIWDLFTVLLGIMALHWKKSQTETFFRLGFPSKNFLWILFYQPECMCGQILWLARTAK